ncbi:unnamed protein product [Closterium sp. NIES-54]
MASLRVLAFDHESRPVAFDTWLDDLQLYLLSDTTDSVLLFDHMSGAATAPPATADSATRSQWLSRDAAARLAIRSHLPVAEYAHFGQHWTTQALDHFLSLDPTSLTVDLLEQHLFAAETSAVDVGAARGTPRLPFVEGCSPSPLAPSYASAAAVHVSVAEDVEAASASAKRRNSKSKGGKGGGGGSGGGGGGNGSSGGGTDGGGGGGGTSGGMGVLVAVVGAVVGVAAVVEVGLVAVGLALGVLVLEVARVSSSSVGARPSRPNSFDFPILRLHSDRGGEFPSDLLRDFCRGEGILQSFTLPDSSQQNEITERRIGFVMEVVRTSMIHAVALRFLWSFAVQYTAHQLNIWPRVSLPETSFTLRWTKKVGDASVFRVWGL